MTTKEIINGKLTYKDAILNLVKNDSKIDFLNSGVEHAVLVSKAIFDHTKDEILLFFRETHQDLLLNNIEYCDSIKDYVYRGGSLEITILDNKEDLKSKVYKTIMGLNKIYPEIVIFKFANPDFIHRVNIGFADKLYSLIIGDKKRIRLEFTPKCKAICCFNNKKHAKKFHKFFKF